MKKVFKEINLLMKAFKRYRLIITNDIIEFKLTPKSNSDKEINCIVNNDKGGKLTLLELLRKIKYEHNID